MRNTQRGFAPLIILLIVLAGGAVVGGGYYAVSKREANVPRSNATSTAELRTQATSSNPTLPSQASATATAATSKESPKPKSEPTATKPVTAAAVSVDAGLKLIPSEGAWPVTVSSTIALNGTIETFTRMAVIRILPKVESTAEYSVTVGGLPANSDLYVYTQGYRVEELKRTSSTGTLTFKLTTGMQFIIKSDKS